jgi:hypothetical protein
MSKRKDVQAVRVEILPPASRRDPRSILVDEKKLLKLVDRRFAQLQARRDEFVFQPFFERKKVSDEIRRLQSVPEQRKWGLYFQRFGCLRCGTRQHIHTNCGMCSRCAHLVYSRLTRIIRGYKRKSEVEQFELMAHEKVARKALMPVLKLLPARISSQTAKSRKRG